MINKVNQVQNPLRLRSSVAAIVASLVLSGLPLVGHAAGLGNITVFSSLGQPLRAEIEISATSNELAGMTARLAPSSAFQQANIDYAATLSGIKFSIDKRPNGHPVIRLKSDKPINEPFVDLLLELNWPTGRLLHEYTFLLDPSEFTAKSAMPAVAVPASRSLPVSSPSPVVDDQSPGKASPQTSTPASSEKAPDQSAGGQHAHTVKGGDTMQKIARETKLEGISLEQMLVGLWQANQQAFAEGNMNRLKVGEVISIPDKATLAATSIKDAKKIILTQSAEWNAYRQKLVALAAQGAAKEDIERRDSAGKIAVKVEETTAPVAESNDRLKVSRMAVAGANDSSKGKRREEDVVARNMALQETKERIATLEINIANMQKLIEMKDQQLTMLQKPMVNNPTTPETPLKPEPTAVPIPPDPTPVATAARTPAELQPIQQEPKVEPGLVEQLLGSPLILVAGGSLALLTFLAGYLFNNRRSSPLAT